MTFPDSPGDGNFSTGSTVHFLAINISHEENILNTDKSLQLVYANETKLFFPNN